MQNSPLISDTSRRIARNTVFLYIRMLVLMAIGLVSYRIILRALGVTDYGVYAAVGGVVTMFMLVMNTVIGAITRFITVELGRGDEDGLRKVFGTSLAIMSGFALLAALLAETAGMWFVENRMVIPPASMPGARAVLHSSMFVLVINLVSIPFTAVINAHEHMSAYAWLSILEGVLKLGVAVLVGLSGDGQLTLYAWLLALVALIVRGAYAAYSAAHFKEVRFPLRASLAQAREIASFTGWNFLGSGAYMLNTQGINQLMNIFFGVGANAARGVADKVEQTVRQFGANIAMALNPQLTKSYASGRKDYAYELTCKGSKYYFWMLLAISLPFFTDADTILRLWVGAEALPAQAALFTKLTLVCFLVDFTPGAITILEMAAGKVGRYYRITSAIAAMTFVLTWILYLNGFPAWAGYIVFIGIYLIKGLAMLLICCRDTGLPLGDYIRKAVVPMLWAAGPGVAAAALSAALLPDAWWRFIAVAATGAAAMGLGIWAGGLTEGEKSYIKSKLPR